MKIKWKIASYVMLPFIIILTIVLIFDIYKTKKIEEEKTYYQLKSLSEKHAAYINSQLIEAAHLAELTAANAEIHPHLSVKKIKDLLRNNLRVNSFIFASAICFIPYHYDHKKQLFVRYAFREEGEIIVSDPAASGYDYTDEKQEYWHIPKKTGEPAWTDPYFDDGAGNILMITYSVPILEEGVFTGIATIDISLEPFKESLSMKIPKEFSYYLITDKGKYIYSTYRENINKLYTESEKPYKKEGIDKILLDSKKGKSPVLKIKNTVTGENDLVAFTPIESTGWTLIISLPESSNYFIVHRQIYGSIFLFLLIIVIAIIGIYFISTRISSPIVKLSSIVKNYAKEDYFIHAEIKGKDEIGELAESFNKMGSELSDRNLIIKKSELKFRGLFDNMIDAFALHKIIFDEKGNPIDYEYINVNKAFEISTGLQKEYIIGKTVTEIMPGTEDDPAGWIDKYAKVAMTGKEISFESYSVILKKWFFIHAYSHKKGYFATIFNDITNRKIDKKKISDLARFPEENANPVYRISKDGILLYANPASQELIPDNDAKVGQKIPEEWIQTIEDVYNSGEKQTIELEFNGKLFIFQQVPIVNSGYVNVYGTDITKRRELENALVGQNKFTETVIETAQVIILVLDTEGKIIKFNPYFEKISGYTLEELKGKDWFSTFLLPGDQNKYRTLFEKAIASSNAKGSQNPIKIKNGELIDVLWYDNTFSDAENNVVGLISIGIDVSESLKYEEQLRQTGIELDNAHKHGMFMLAVASEYKDRETGDHIKRIADLTKELAKEFGESAKSIDKLGTDSILHDLGKLGIPDSILLKPGKLTAEEFEIVKQHTMIGANIIGDDKWFIQAREIALYHHEKWDGSGYPMSLKGTDIPFAARIVAVVDVFDALIARRPYKEPWPLDKAVAEVKNGTGKHFDPKVVDAFVNLHKKGHLAKYVVRALKKLS